MDVEIESYLDFNDQYLEYVTICHLDMELLELQIHQLQDLWVRNMLPEAELLKRFFYFLLDFYSQFFIFLFQP